MSRALGEACWAWALEAWARRRVSREVGEDEMRWIALLSIAEAIVADDDVAMVVEMMEMGKMVYECDVLAGKKMKGLQEVKLGVYAA